MFNDNRSHTFEINIHTVCIYKYKYLCFSLCHSYQGYTCTWKCAALTLFISVTTEMNNILLSVGHPTILNLLLFIYSQLSRKITKKDQWLQYTLLHAEKCSNLSLVILAIRGQCCHLLACVYLLYMHSTYIFQLSLRVLTCCVAYGYE